MKIEFQESFLKDLEKINDKTILRRIWDIVYGIENANDFLNVSKIKKLQGKGSF